MKPILCLILMLSLFFVVPLQAQTFSSVAKPRKMPAGAPKYSDVCFSSRKRHPDSPKDSLNTFEMAKRFHATRIEWVYSTDVNWIREVKSMGYFFGGAINSILPDQLHVNTRSVGRIVDSLGNKVEAPWMKGWNTFWGCVNSPEYRNTYLAHAKRLVDAGVDVIQMDDPAMNIAAKKWGGCYCVYCKDKAKAQGKTVTGIQDSSVVEFFRDMRKAINQYAGKEVPFSSNNYRGNWEVPAKMFDYGEAEFPEKELAPNMIYMKLKEAARMGKAQVFTLPSGDVLLNRKAIATAYASGGHLIVPWDVWLKGSTRYYGKPEDFADLYGFLRNRATLLDGYEDAQVTGSGIIDDRYSENPVTLAGGTGQVYAFTRAKPGEPGAPVVIHLVEWATTAQPFTITVNLDNWKKGNNAKCFLNTPGRKELSERKPLKTTITGRKVTISIPALAPYGILELI